MSVMPNAAMLNALTRELWGHWQQTKEHWTDEKRQEFERLYLDELMSSVNRAVAQIQELDKVLSKIRSDCE